MAIMNLTFAAAAPITVKLSGKPYRFSPLTINDLAEYEAWSLGFALDRDEALKIADDSAEGVVKLTWFSLRKSHPELSEDDVLGLVSSKNTLTIVTETIYPHIFGSSFLDVARKESSVKSTQTDWTWVYKAFAEMYHFSPDVVGNLTMDQVTMYLGADKKMRKFGSNMIDAAKYIESLKNGQSISNN